MVELLETGIEIDLEYDEGCGALVGEIGGLSVVIKENNETKSYGCLIWISDESDDSDELSAYLEKQVAEKPHIIKHFRVAGRGAAIALVKYNDATRNIKNIKQFMEDLGGDLHEHGYANCCYSCGSTEGLGIYDDKGSVSQYCLNCRKGRLVKAVDTAVMFALPADGDDSGDNYAADDDDVLKISDENVDLSGLMVGGDDKEEGYVPPRSEIFEAAQREFEEERRFSASADDEQDKALDSLMFSSDDDASDARESEAPAAIFTSDISGGAELDGLMFDENDTAGEDPDEEAESDDDVDNANIYGLMVGSEQEFAETGTDEVDDLVAYRTGGGKALEVAVQEEERVGEDDEIAVTELHDDSNDGEDITITALESDIGKPTDSAGEQLTASDTPLESDGTVPLINPTSDFAAEHRAPSYEKGAVRAFAYGSYDNATAADEPVGFDGRPKGYKFGDPRLGDETGSRSRDYSRQQISLSDSDSRKYRSESHVVGGKAKASSKPLPSYSSYSGSNVVLGIIAAVLFGVIGCAIWCGIGYIVDLMVTLDDNTKSIIIAVCAFIPALFTFVGYRIGGDGFDIRGIVVSAVITVIMDGVGIYAVLVTDVMRSSAEIYGYDISVDKAMSDLAGILSDSSLNGSLFQQLWLAVAVMIVALAGAVVVAKKRS